MNNNQKLSNKDIDAYIRNTIEEYAEEIEEWAKQGHSAKQIFTELIQLERKYYPRYRSMFLSRFSHIRFSRQLNVTRQVARQHKTFIVSRLQMGVPLSRIARDIGTNYWNLCLFIRKHPEEFQE